jgi:diazepam-binding inhibitor (GABA receptor modulating acyl-CoA-binding protein)
MDNLIALFERAVLESKSLPERPDNLTLLKIYALYKQVQAGDIQGERPGFADIVARAKWDAWNAVRGKTTEEAMREYVALIEALKKQYGV